MIDSLFHGAYLCLTEPDINKKLYLTDLVVHRWRKGFQLKTENTVLPGEILPGIPDRPKIVNNFNLPPRGTGTLRKKLALIHSFAHIEFNAINLAWDIVTRFRDMPDKFYNDWIQIASEEKKHFILLRDYLNMHDYDYGDFDAHDGLWQLADITKNDILDRIVLVPRVMEARGLDVTPDMIKRFSDIGDSTAADILKTILEDEIEHVKCGTYWFHYICNCRNLDCDETFIRIIEKYTRYLPKFKINYDARIKAGFTNRELQHICNL